MAASRFVEQESGTYSGRVHPHNGYYAGDFSSPRQDPPPAWRSPIPPSTPATTLRSAPGGRPWPSTRSVTTPSQRGPGRTCAPHHPRGVGTGQGRVPGGRLVTPQTASGARSSVNSPPPGQGGCGRNCVWNPTPVSPARPS